MNAIDEILRQLSKQGVLNGIQSEVDRMRDSLALSGAYNFGKTALERFEEENRRQIEQLTYLNAGYGLTSVTQELAQQDLGLRLALSNSYANLTGAQVWAKQGLLSQHELVRHLEDIVSPLASVKSALSQSALPESVASALSQLGIADHLIGEFAYTGAVNHEQEEEIEESPLREEVESRIIQVNYLPQKIFEAIRNEPKLMRGLDPRKFEEFTAELLAKLGFTGIQLTPRSGDGGRDIVATQEVNQIPIVMAFECKKYAESNKIGPDILRALLGTVAHSRTKASIGVLVTTSSFTTGARTFMAAEALIDGKDFNALAKWLVKAGSRAGG